MAAPCCHDHVSVICKEYEINILIYNGKVCRLDLLYLHTFRRYEFLGDPTRQHKVSTENMPNGPSKGFDLHHLLWEGVASTPTSLHSFISSSFLTHLSYLYSPHSSSSRSCIISHSTCCAGQSSALLRTYHYNAALFGI